MHVKSLLSVATLLLASTTLHAATDADAASTFSVTTKTEVPGTVLTPGDYTIRVLDHLTDRVIVRIDSASGSQHTIFLGVPNPAISKGSGSGAVNWSSSPKGTDALRGFSFPTGSAIEFVYPKAEAAALAKLNTGRVIAVDPASEGRPSNLKNLSNDDMTMVNLWMLSLTTATPKDKTPALLAQKYKAESGTEVAQTAPAPVAAPAPAASTPVAPRPAPAANTQVARLDQPKLDAPARVAPTRKPVLAKLPKTGSFLPLVPTLWIVGLLSLLSAAVIRSTFVRGSRQEAR